jgi:hypothetical protein
LLKLSKGNKEKRIKNNELPIIYINPCFPKPFTLVKILYLKSIIKKAKEKVIALNRKYFILLIRSNDEIVRPVTANGIVSAKYPTENLIILLYLVKN